MVGTGLGLLLANTLTGHALPILLLGLTSRSLGMFQKHELERGEHVRIWWVESLYWLCWVALAALLACVVIRQF